MYTYPLIMLGLVFFALIVSLGNTLGRK